MNPRVKEWIVFLMTLGITFMLGLGMGINYGRYREPVSTTMRWVAPKKIAILKMAQEELDSSRGMLEQMYQEINRLQAENDSLRGTP